MSSSKAEYIVINELVKKVEFVRQLIEIFDIQTDLLIPLIVNNIKIIHMARNNTSGTETRYVNIRFHYVRDFHNNQIVVLQFVKSENNESDIITKNLTQKNLRDIVPN